MAQYAFLSYTFDSVPVQPEAETESPRPRDRKATGGAQGKDQRTPRGEADASLTHVGANYNAVKTPSKREKHQETCTKALSFVNLTSIQVGAEKQASSPEEQTGKRRRKKVMEGPKMVTQQVVLDPVLSMFAAEDERPKAGVQPSDERKQEFEVTDGKGLRSTMVPRRNRSTTPAASEAAPPKIFAVPGEVLGNDDDECGLFPKKSENVTKDNDKSDDENKVIDRSDVETMYSPNESARVPSVPRRQRSESLCPRNATRASDKEEETVLARSLSPPRSRGRSASRKSARELADEQEEYYETDQRQRYRSMSRSRRSTALAPVIERVTESRSYDNHKRQTKRAAERGSSKCKSRGRVDNCDEDSVSVTGSETPASETKNSNTDDDSRTYDSFHDASTVNDASSHGSFDEYTFDDPSIDGNRTAYTSDSSLGLRDEAAHIYAGTCFAVDEKLMMVKRTEEYKTALKLAHRAKTETERMIHLARGATLKDVQDALERAYVNFIDWWGNKPEADKAALDGKTEKSESKLTSPKIPRGVVTRDRRRSARVRLLSESAEE